MTTCQAGRTGAWRADHIPPPEPDRCAARPGGQGRRQHSGRVVAALSHAAVIDVTAADQSGV